MAFHDQHEAGDLSDVRPLLHQQRWSERLQGYGTYFDYLYGRVLKVDLSGDEFDERLYERDNGRDSAARAIAFLK